MKKYTKARCFSAPLLFKVDCKRSYKFKPCVASVSTEWCCPVLVRLTASRCLPVAHPGPTVGSDLVYKEGESAHYYHIKIQHIINLLLLLQPDQFARANHYNNKSSGSAAADTDTLMLSACYAKPL